MPRIKLKQVDGIRHTTVSYALDAFLRHCQFKNTAPHTYTYYKENLQNYMIWEADNSLSWCLREPEALYDYITEECQ